MRIPFALIVEGHGEGRAVPVLLRRVLSEVDPELNADIRFTLRAPATRLLKPDELERHVELAVRRGGLDCRFPADPEAIRGAKEWLSRAMESDCSYQETLDQAALTAIFDLAEARRVPSFSRFEREVRRLVGV